MQHSLPGFAVRTFTALLLLCGAVAAAAAPLAPEVQWKDPSSVDLEVDFPGEGYHASWQLFRCRCGDLLIRSELVMPGEVTQGDILLVANRAVLLRGYGPDAAQNVSFDAPALMMQLALRLLERLEPAGPSAIVERREGEVEDLINPINLDTGVVSGGFPAPWRVQALIWPQADTQRRFDLAFSFNAPGEDGSDAGQGKMRLSGVAEYAAGEFPLGAEMTLQGWTLSWRDQDDAAAEKAGQAATLGELRQLLQAE
jgi:hypothetical protein